MLLLLYQDLKIHTRLSRAAIQEHLAALTNTAQGNFPRFGFSKNSRFIGRIGHDDFKIVYYDRYIKGIVCTGSMKNSPEGTELNMTLRPHALICLTSLYFYLEVIGWSIYFSVRLWRQLPPAPGETFCRQLISSYALLYLMLYLWFRFCTRKVKTVWTDRLH